MTLARLRTARHDTSSPKSRSLVAVLVLGAAVSIAGCAARSGPARRPTYSGPQPSPTELITSLEARRAVVRAARGTTKLAISGYEASETEPVRRNLRTSQAVVARAPNSFRMDTITVVGVSYAVACDGAEVAVMIPVEKKLLRGSAAVAEIGAATGVFLGPEDVVSLLLGLPPGPLPDPARSRVEEPTADDRSPPVIDAMAPEPLADFVLASARPDGTTERIGFSAQHDGALRPVSYVRRAASGEVILEAGFEDWAPAGSIDFARRIAIRVLTSEALLTWTEVSVDPPIDAMVFRLTTPAGYRERPLVQP